MVDKQGVFYYSVGMKIAKERRAEVVEWCRSHRLVQTDSEVAAHFDLPVSYVTKLRQRAGIMKGLQVQAFMREQRGRAANRGRYEHGRMSDAEKIERGLARRLTRAERKQKRSGGQSTVHEPQSAEEWDSFMRSKGYVV